MRERTRWHLLQWLMLVTLLMNAQGDEADAESTTKAVEVDDENSTGANEVAEATNEASNNNNDASNGNGEATNEASNNNNEASNSDGEATNEASNNNNDASNGDGEATNEASNNNNDASNGEGEAPNEPNEATENVIQVEESTTLAEGGNDGTGEGEVGGGAEETEEEGGDETVTEVMIEIRSTFIGTGYSNDTDSNNTETTKASGAGEVTEHENITTTTLPTTTTTGLQCGENAEEVDDVCKCQVGWVRDPSDSLSTSCLCPDLCNDPGRMTCPRESRCYHMTCNVVSCECQNKKYYDPAAKTCQDPCTYFGDAVCGLGLDRTCQVSASTDVGYICPCAAGYTLVNDTCVDKNECQASQTCPGVNEQCEDVKGSYLCPCMNGYMRTESGSCINVNECINPRLHDCDHVCEDATPGYTCSCYTGYTWNDTTLRRCQLDNESTSCECSDPTKSICYQPSTGGDPECNPKPGYQLVNGSYTDQEECGQNASEWCGVQGVCIEGTGSSVCECQEGYINDTLNYGQCVDIKCPAGTLLSGSDCVEPCSLVSCTAPMRCVVTSSGSGKCVCGTLCQGLLQPQVNTSIYYGALVVTTTSGGEDTAPKVTKMLNAYFGKDNVEVLKVKPQNMKRATDSLKTLLVEFIVMTDRPNMTQEVTQIIRGQCQSSNSTPGTCILPGGLVVMENSIQVQTKDPCQNNPCPSDLFQCTERTDITGRFTCICLTGYRKVDVGGTPGYCQDVNECNVTESGCENNDECINTPGSFVCRTRPRAYMPDNVLLDLTIAFGVLFVVTLLIAMGLGYLLMKRSHRVREMVPMTETSASPGFENHGYHK